MKTRKKIAAHLLVLVLAFAAVGCSTSGTGAKNAAGAGQPRENADLWRKVKNDPAAYVPRAWPKTVPAELARGKWIVDARDATSGGVSPGSISPSVCGIGGIGGTGACTGTAGR